MARGERAAEELPNELVYGGFSLGVVPAQKLAQTRDGARGALFFYSAIPVSEFGVVACRRPGADPRDGRRPDLRRTRATSTPPARSSTTAEDGELFLYPGDQHYFADSSLPSYDENATKLLTQRVLEFLDARG